MTEPPLADLFEDSWRSASGDDLASRAARRSLEAAATGFPDLARLVTWLKAPSQAEFDVHLEGGTIRNHQTDALPFGKFVQRTAESVKELAKSISGRQRMSADLQIFAPTAGSVRVVFRAPDAPGDSAETRPAYDATSANSLALERLVDVLDAAAHDDASSTATLAAVHQLTPRARVAVGRTARVISEGGWDLQGELRRRGQDPRQVTVSRSAAARIASAADHALVESSTQTLVGTIDGARRSTLVMWFEPDEGRAFAASVPSPELMALVTQLAARDNPRVRARFTVYTAYGTESSQHTTRRFELTSLSLIEPPAETAELDLSPGPG